MIQVKGYKQIRRRVFIAVFVISQLSLAVTPSLAHADPAIDSQPPILQPSIKNGEYRNNVTFRLDAADDHMQSVSIEVLAPDDTPLSPRVFSEKSDGAASTSLTWQTTDPNDGNYKVRYTAVDAAGNISTETHAFRIINAQPLVTLNDKAEGRTISGTISRADVTFLVKFDGVTREVAPQIAEAPDSNGTYQWTLAVPSEITDGTHLVEVAATSKVTNQTSPFVSHSLLLATPLTVIEPAGVDTPIPAVVSISDYAQEVGQFIAPALPAAAQTTLFGVSTTDITENIPTKQGVVPAPQNARTVLYSGDIQPQSRRDIAPIAATESGWMVFGIAWYWWSIAALVLSVTTACVIKSMKRDQPKSIFTSAESA